ncbi:MAG TPA: alpha/beta fold hydrolase [Vicinamibacterales bacterium]|nr:alpha/beta fold hydrolase [Vicinamibacterales bacterium]
MPTGIRFTETMRGHFSTDVLDDYGRAEQRGIADGSTLDFTVTVSSDNLDDMLSNPAHAARIDGTIACPALSPQPLQVSGGTFHLLVKDPTRVNARLMTYRMIGVAADGKRYRVDGFKVIQDDRHLEIWDDTTTLFTTVTDVNGAAETVIGKGILHILPADFMKQMTTMEVTGAATPLDALRGMVAFGSFFAGALFDTYGGVLVRSNELQPDGQPRQRRPLKMSAPEVHFFATADGVELRLTRYKGGAKGPVMLAPGFGTSTLAFSIDTVDTNLPEALFAAGYDVWLFDYRASPDLASSRTQFTLDEIAKQDYPAAVAKVREIAQVPTVQVMAHCVGSMTLLMSLLSGLQGVRSAVCSALTFFPISPMANRIRANLDLGKLLTAAHVETLTTDFDSQKLQDRLVDMVLKTFPSPEQCTSAVCRRILGIYGEVYKHAMLNDATHNAIHEMFGVANVSTFNHLAAMVRAEKIVDKNGDDTYLTPENLKRLTLPITFLHGAENNLFLPEGSLKTLKTLAQANDALLYDRIEFPNYAHMDCYMGRDASRDIFPTIVSALDRHNESAVGV